MKGVKRNKNQCRLVLTVEVEAPPGMVSLFPSHQKDVVDHLRDREDLPEVIHQIKIAMAVLVRQLGVDIISQKFEVTK